MKPRFRLPLGDLGGGNRLILEMQSESLLPLVNELAAQLDDIRTMLLRGSVGPARAHVLLLKCIRLNREKLYRLAEEAA